MISIFPVRKFISKSGATDLGLIGGEVELEHSLVAIGEQFPIRIEAKALKKESTIRKLNLRETQ